MFEKQNVLAQCWRSWCWHHFLERALSIDHRFQTTETKSLLDMVCGLLHGLIFYCEQLKFEVQSRGGEAGSRRHSITPFITHHHFGIIIELQNINAALY